MIVVVTTKEKNERTGREELIVSHGVDVDTGRMVILPCEPPQSLGATFDENLGEYVLESPSKDSAASRPRP